MDNVSGETAAPQNSIWPSTTFPPDQSARYDRQHRDNVRLKALQMAIDTVPMADSDHDGMKTARRVATVYNFYLDILEKGYTPPSGTRLPRQVARK